MITLTNRNKLIAEFMGVKTITIDELKSTLEQNRENGLIHTPQAHVVDDLKYHTSWDWLIPVVREILTRIDIDSIEYETHNLEYETLDADIKGAYKQVVEFIEWYNEQN